ncbi:MAG: inositol monophosphatase family protein [Bacteroidales bacterium]|nr:inositol monophosphatase family protein [Bacteroidales bacterium]HNW74296.1 inositol monophosphatase family protein [Bacteroidales bacterium]HPS51458.1 inositol monophosphatase family protein [Bacteroidales bacterium]
MIVNLEQIALQVCNLARETGKFLLREVDTIQHADVEEKGLHNFVTRVDRESERRLVDRLSVILPGSGFIAEENRVWNPSEYTWIIDPLDGTTNFIHRVPLFAISIALMRGQETLLGVIYEANHDECFHTWKNAPSFLNDRPIRVSDTALIHESLFATGFPYYDYNQLDDYLQLFRHLLKNSRGVRRLGSAATDLAWVACGRFDGFYEYGLSPWDVAAGGLIVQNAGGKVSDFRSGENYIFGRQIIAANKNIYPEFLKLFDTWKHELS